MYACSIFCSYKNGEKFLDGYVENLLGQSIYKDIEFLFIDCNKNENNKLIKLAKSNKNFKYIKLPQDPGLYASWNIAIKNSTTEYLSNWNIDDRKSSIGVEILYNNISKNEDIDLVYGQTYISKIPNERYIDNDFEEIFPCQPPGIKSFIQNNSPHCMPMWRKRIHERFGYFNETYKIASDSDMWIRTLIGGGKAKMLNHPVGLYYYNPEGASTNPAKLKESVEEVNRMRSKYIQYI